MVESGVDCIDIIDRRLTLDGLQMLYEKNKGLNKKRVLQARLNQEKALQE
jgi:type III pantothenate kinase